MPAASKTIALVAGEASGDLLGAHLIEAVRRQAPDVRFVGIGGPKMKAAGMEVWYPLEKLAVNGYAEVLRHLPELLRIRRELKVRLLAERPALFLGIDAPDFNLGLELKLRRGGIPTLHYVSPSIWAWRGERIHKIKRAVSEMLALFPFEPAIYEKAGMQARYVGHPLADMLPLKPDRAAMREQMKLPQDRKVFALLPGSRMGEVRQHAALFIESAKLILQRIPDAHFLVPLVNRETRELFEQTLWQMEGQALPMTLMFGHAHDAMTACDGVLIASGTATLEAALLKRPMVITYRLSKLSWRLMKGRNYQPYVGLPNILAGRFVVPELLQDDATPENLVNALLNMVTRKEVVAGLEAEFTRMHLELRQNTAERVAEALLPWLERSA
jgi:lipid-A-disaccharide synthase